MNKILFCNVTNLTAVSEKKLPNSFVPAFIQTAQVKLVLPNSQLIFTTALFEPALILTAQQFLTAIPNRGLSNNL